MKNPIPVLLLLLAFATGANAQCPVGQYIVPGQAGLNRFPVDYPQCESLDGLVANQSPAYDLSPLANIKTIKGNATFGYSPSFKSLSGMAALEEIGGNLTIDGMDSVLDFSGWETLEKIGGDFRIIYNPELVSLQGLFSLKEIGGKLEILGNGKLKTLLESSSLRFLGLTPKSDLIIRRNDNLENLIGLAAIKEVKGNLVVQENKALENIEGLSGIGLVDSSISISGNAVLENVDGLRNLETCNFKIDISKNPKMNTLNLPALKSVKTRISILENVELRSLKGMNSLLKFDGDLVITKNYKLDTVQAFNNLREAGTLIDIKNNGPFPDFGFLGKLKTVTGSLYTTAAYPMRKIGLDSLTHVGVDFMVQDHFQTLAGLERLEYVGQRFLIHADSLESLLPLSRLDTVRHLSIQTSWKLASLAGIDNIDPGAMGMLMISGNPKLAHCAVKSVCDYLNGPGTFYLSSGIGNCLDTAAVRRNCNEANGVSPRAFGKPAYPAAVQATADGFEIRFTLPERSPVGIRVYDTRGRLMAERQLNSDQAGDGRVVIPVAGMRRGLYLTEVRLGSAAPVFLGALFL